MSTGDGKALMSLKVGFSFWEDGFGGCVAEREGPGGREAGIGLLQGFMQKMVKSELDSGPEDGAGGKGTKNCLDGRMAGAWGLIKHVAGG